MDNLVFVKTTGKGKTIVVIDEGYSTKDDSYVYDGISFSKHENSSKDDLFFHGSYCSNIIKEVASGCKIVMLNAFDTKIGAVTEYTIIKAIEFALTLNPDIISISLSLNSSSDALINIINTALSKGIIICASVDPVIANSHPSCLKGVIAVDECIVETSKEIVCFNDVIYISKTKYDFIQCSGSSMANAFFSAHCARLLEFNPLATAESITDYYRTSSLPKMDIKDKSAYILYNNTHDIDMYKNMISSRYNMYFDIQNSLFRSLDNDDICDNLDQIASIDIIVGDDDAVKRPHLPEYISKLNKKIRFYDNIEYTADAMAPNNPLIKPINVPSICIASYGNNMDKLKIQIYLNKNFQDAGYSVGNITFNPIGLLYNFDFIQYPKSVVYPDYFYFINYQMYKSSQRKDLLISSIPGEIDRFINSERQIGTISQIFTLIHNIDVVILSVSSFIEIPELLSIKYYIESTVGAKLIFYISNKSRDERLFWAEKYNNYISQSHVQAVKKDLSQCFENPIYTFDEATQNVELFNEVLGMLTNVQD